MAATKALPEVVSRDKWQAARDELLVEEKELTRALDRLAAKRRRMPMVRMSDDYRFTAPLGDVSLRDLFHGHRRAPARITVFLRDGDDVYQTYFTAGRGADRLRFDFNLRLDSLRPPGDLGGLTAGLAADAALPVVAPPRRVLTHAGTFDFKRRAEGASRQAQPAALQEARGLIPLWTAGCANGRRRGANAAPKLRQHIAKSKSRSRAESPAKSPV